MAVQKRASPQEQLPSSPAPPIFSKISYLRPELREASKRGEVEIATRRQRLAATTEETVLVHDVRGEELSLDTNGFVILPLKTGCTSFKDQKLVRSVYFPELVALVKEVTGAEEVVILGETVRTDEDYSFAQEKGEEWGGLEGPTHARTDDKGTDWSPYAHYAHIDVNDDYSRKAPRRFARLASRPTEKGGLGFAPGREEDYDFVDYSLWQPIDREVQQMPLALLDARTLDQEKDLSPAFTPESRKIGGTNGVSRNPGHRWCYFPRMQTDEILLFMGMKQDPKKRQSHIPGSGRSCAHVAVWDPTAPVDAPPRRSVETRLIAAFPKSRVPKEKTGTGELAPSPKL